MSASFDMSKPPPLEMSTQDRLAKMAQPDIVEENTPSLNIADIPSQDLKSAFSFKKRYVFIVSDG